MIATLDKVVLLSAAGLVALALYAVLHALAGVDDDVIRFAALLGAIGLVLARPPERR